MAADLLALGLDPQRLHALVHAQRLGGPAAILRRGAGGARDARRRPARGARGFARSSSSATAWWAPTPRAWSTCRARSPASRSVALFSEVEPGKVKVSLRSTGRVESIRSARASAAAGTRTRPACCSAARAPRRRARILPELERAGRRSSTPSPGRRRVSAALERGGRGGGRGASKCATLAHRYGARAGLEPLTLRSSTAPGVTAVTGAERIGQEHAAAHPRRTAAADDGRGARSRSRGARSPHPSAARPSGFATPELSVLRRIHRAARIWRFAAEARGPAIARRGGAGGARARRASKRAPDDRVAALSSGHASSACGWRSRCSPRRRCCCSMSRAATSTTPGVDVLERIDRARSARTGLVLLATNDEEGVEPWRARRIELRGRGLGHPA